MKYDDALSEARNLVATLQREGYLKKDMKDDEVENLANKATMDAYLKFDQAMRGLAYQRQVEFEPVVAKRLVMDTLKDLLDLFRDKQLLKKELPAVQIDQLAEPLVKDHGLSLVKVPRQDEMNKFITAATQKLVEQGVVDASPELLVTPDTLYQTLQYTIATVTGEARTTLFTKLFDRFKKRLDQQWIQHVKFVNWELEDKAFDRMVGILLNELQAGAKPHQWMIKEPAGAAIQPLRKDHVKKFAKKTFLWHKDKTDLVKEMDSELQMPGWGNIWTQPIINRVDMLATGVRTMIGVKVYGPRQDDVIRQVTENGQIKQVVTDPGIQSVANEIAEVLKGINGAVDVFPDQVVGRSYLQIDVNREKAARYGVNVADVTDAIEVAMGGKAITTTIEGRRRFPVRVRYARDFWQTQDELKRILVTGRRGSNAASESVSVSDTMNKTGAGIASGMGGGQTIQIPITEVADIQVVEGPSVIKSENGMLRSYVQLNVRDRDLVGFVEEARRAVADKVKLPPGFFIEWSGQFEHQVRARKTLQIIFPMVILVMFVILYMTFNDVRDALLIVLAVPGALVGGVIFQSLFGFNFSVAVWVGYIACFGEATQTGIVMLVYLREAIHERGGLKNIQSLEELRDTVITGAVHRLRPKLITEGCAIIGLMPMLWATGVGAEVMKPMAAPVLGGLLVAYEVIDLLLPVIFNWYQGRKWKSVHNI